MVRAPLGGGKSQESEVLLACHASRVDSSLLHTAIILLLVDPQGTRPTFTPLFSFLPSLSFLKYFVFVIFRRNRDIATFPVHRNIPDALPEHPLHQHMSAATWAAFQELWVAWIWFFKLNFTNSEESEFINPYTTGWRRVKKPRWDDLPDPFGSMVHTEHLADKPTAPLSSYSSFDLPTSMLPAKFIGGKAWVKVNSKHLCFGVQSQ